MFRIRKAVNAISPGACLGGVRLGAIAALLLLASLADAASPGAQFEREWSNLIAAAQKEGRVLIAAGGSPSREYRPLVELFQNKFGIKVSLSTGSGAATVDRVLAERQAGKHTVDLGLTSVAATRTRLIPAKALDPVPPLLVHPDVLDKSAWFGGRHWYADPEEQKFSFVYAVEPTETFAVWYNTNVISKSEIATIKSPRDLLDPKWRGKITSRTWGDRGRLGEMQNIYFQPDMGIEWIKAFFEQTQAKFSDDVRLRESWIIGGSAPIAFSDGDIDRELERLEKAGMPVAMHAIPYALPFLAAGSSGCCIQVYNRAPHPNAAKLYLNWFLSKEGQTAMHELKPAIDRQSLREDIPAGNLEARHRRVPGRKYIFRDADPKYVAQDHAQREAIVNAWEESRRRK